MKKNTEMAGTARPTLAEKIKLIDYVAVDGINVWDYSTLLGS